MPRAEKRALSVPLSPAAAAPRLRRTWSDLAGLRPPPLARRSVTACSGVAARTMATT